MNLPKLVFIKTELIFLLKKLEPTSAGKWGKMNAGQMVEHLSGFFKVSTNQLQFPLLTSEEDLPKYKAFLYSDKLFRENTKAPMLPDEPSPVVFSSLTEAINELEKQITLFVEKFSSKEIITSQHPVFGELNFEEWVLLHFKHSVHHLTQFSLM